MDKDQIAEVLVNVATLLELNGENPFKARAYTNAARALESMSEPLEKVIAENRLSEISGIGESIQKKITELVSTGKLVYYEAIGYKDKAAAKPMSKDAIFRIYSMTKPLVSVVAMMLVEEGVV